jgi:hypothetical protein
MENSFRRRKKKYVDVSQAPPKQRKGDVVRSPTMINTPLVVDENAPSSSGQGTHVVRPLEFMIELVLQNSFSWVF